MDIVRHLICLTWAAGTLWTDEKQEIGWFDMVSIAPASNARHVLLHLSVS